MCYILAGIRLKFSRPSIVSAVRKATETRIGLEGLLSRVAGQVHAHATPNEAPLRAEVFSIDQLAQHAKALAASHRIVTRRSSNRLLARLAQNEQLLRAYN